MMSSAGDVTESLRAIAETFHAAKKLNDEDVTITVTKLDKYEMLCSFFSVAAVATGACLCLCDSRLRILRFCNLL